MVESVLFHLLLFLNFPLFSLSLLVSRGEPCHRYVDPRSFKYSKANAKDIFFFRSNIRSIRVPPPLLSVLSLTRGDVVQL